MTRHGPESSGISNNQLKEKTVQSGINGKIKNILMEAEEFGNIIMSAQAELPSQFGNFTIVGFLEKDTGKEHSAIIKGSVYGKENVPCRIHSECHTGDVLGSLRCDCRAQLEQSLRYIEKNGEGLVIYLRQEGRGIGLVNKINAYKLQQEGLDTVEANVELGFPAEARQYSNAAEILKILNVQSIKLLSNNPHKFRELRDEGISIHSRIPLIIEPNNYNRTYLHTKKTKMNHSFEKSEELLSEQYVDEGLPLFRD